MARKNDRSPVSRPRVDALESRQLLTATLVDTFGNHGQLIGSTHKSGTTSTLIPYAHGGVYEFTNGNTITRRLGNGSLDKSFFGTGTMKIASSNPIEAITAAPDGSLYVEYGLLARGSTTVSNIGFQHFLKTGRLDTKFGSNRLLNMANYARTATFQPGPMTVSPEGRLYWQGASTTSGALTNNVFYIPSNGSVAGIRQTDATTAGSRIVIGRSGSIFVIGSGVTQYNLNFQRVRTYGTNATALSGQTVLEGAIDTSGRLVLAMNGAASTDASQIVRLTTRGVLDQTFGTKGSVTLPANYFSAGTAYTGSHLLIQSDNSVIVSGGLTSTKTTGSTTTTTTQAALLEYSSDGKLVDKAFSTNSNGGLTSSNGTLEGTEVDVAFGPDGTVYLATVIDRAATSGTAEYEFIERFSQRPFSGV